MSELVIVESPPCPGCGLVQTFEVNQRGIQLWKSGTVIQRALSELDRDQREAMMTGYCVPCWKAVCDE